MKIDSKPYGEIEVDTDKIITFSDGLLGFEDVHEYVVIGKEEERPFEWLQAVHDPGLAFVVISPRVVRPDYHLNLGHQDAQELDVDQAENLLVYCLVTIPEDNPDNMTVNLRGPVVINDQTFEGKQIINQDDRYTVRHSLQEELENQAEESQAEQPAEAEDPS